MSQTIQPKDAHLNPLQVELFTYDNDGAVLVYRCQDTVTQARFNMRRDALAQFWKVPERRDEHDPLR